jgi:hypothetical protein
MRPSFVLSTSEEVTTRACRLAALFPWTLRVHKVTIGGLFSDLERVRREISEDRSS